MTSPDEPDVPQTNTPQTNKPQPESSRPESTQTCRSVVVWLIEDTWVACIDALARISDIGAVTLLHVTDSRTHQATQGALSGLLGRGRTSNPDRQIAEASDQAAQALLSEARDRFGRDANLVARAGRPEREVVAAAQHADLLICARDGDRARLGPASLGRDLRFVVDHAPCAVLLIWPDTAPDIDSIPPPPQHPPQQPPGRHNKTQR